MSGTALYQRTLAYDYGGDEERKDLMREVWSPTPWMVNAYTGRTADDRDCEIRQWCRDRFGDECFPIHGKPGQWQRGGATVYGWTGYGFATEAQMNEFVAAWPLPPGVAPIDGAAA